MKRTNVARTLVALRSIALKGIAAAGESDPPMNRCLMNPESASPKRPPIRDESDPYGEGDC